MRRRDIRYDVSRCTLEVFETGPRRRSSSETDPFPSVGNGDPEGGLKWVSETTEVSSTCGDSVTTDIKRENEVDESHLRKDGY